jgi:predicted ABC-type ATPase
MFAGPNGSGKSTIKDYLIARHIGAYLNADELEKILNQTQILDLDIIMSDLDRIKLLEFLKTKKNK